MQRFQDQVAIITGGAQGIGLGTARRLGSEGARLALFDHEAEPLQRAQSALEREGYTVATHRVDVTDHGAVAAAVGQVAGRFGRIDVLVTAAGTVGKTNIKTHEVEPDNFDFVFKVNVHGIFYCCREVLPHMVRADYGRIVNIASISGKEGNAGMLAYSSSKAAVIGLTKVIGKEYAETGITCNAISPAVIRTRMVESLPEAQVKYMTDKIPMKRTGEIDEIAALAAYIASPECSFTTAFCFDASGGRATY